LDNIKELRDKGLMEEKAASKEAEEHAYFEADHIEYREEP